MDTEEEPSSAIDKSRFLNKKDETFQFLQQLQKKSMVEGLPIIKATTGICKGCVVGKHPDHKYDRGKENRATCILGLILFDINGPMVVTSMNGSRYLMTFIDDFSRYTWVFFLKFHVVAMSPTLSSAFLYKVVVRRNLVIVKDN